MRRIVPSLIWFSALAWGSTSLAEGRGAALPVQANPCRRLPVVEEAGADTVVYVNREYGFTFTLPQSWKGFRVLQCEWSGERDSGPVSEHGPVLRLRHPLYTEESPREDIPIMVFTKVQWRDVSDATLNVSAAPFPPDVLGRNRKYVFALRPRFTYDELEGVEEVREIVCGAPLRPARISHLSDSTKP